MVNYDKKPRFQMGTKQGKKGFCMTKFDEFCKTTDLHGYKYMVMEELTTIERICWTLTIIVSIAVAAFLVVTAYKWYARNPIVTVIESTQGATWDVPFPAITICNLNLVSKKSAYNLSMSMSLPGDITPEKVLSVLQLAPMIHTPYVSSAEQRDQLKILQVAMDHNNISIKSLFEKLAPADTCNYLIERCMWKNAMMRCDKLFKQITTLWNQCCSFNNFAVPSKKTEKGMHSEETPRRVASCGYQTALTVILRIDPDDYFSTLVSSRGTMVIIDTAYNYPTQASPARIVNPSTEVMIALSPERTYATSGIKYFSLEERKCIYNDELNLDGFQQYSLHNCMTVLRVRVLNKTCGCIPFYFPIQIMNQELATGKKACLAECERFDYLIEVAMGKLSKNVDVRGLPFFKDIDLANRSLLNVFFNDLVSTTYRRDVYLNWQNILAAFGGLLGLMLGFTLISGIDLLLFVIVRVFYEYLVKHLPERYRIRKIRTEKIEADSKSRANNWIDQSFKKQMVAPDYNKWERHNKVNNREKY